MPIKSCFFERKFPVSHFHVCRCLLNYLILQHLSTSFNFLRPSADHSVKYPVLYYWAIYFNAQRSLLGNPIAYPRECWTIKIPLVGFPIFQQFSARVTPLPPQFRTPFSVPITFRFGIPEFHSSFLFPTISFQ